MISSGPGEHAVGAQRDAEAGSRRRQPGTVSVIIPILNEAAIAEQRLATLQFLRAGGHELVMVDGGSRDGTREIARPLVDKLLMGRAGRAIQMNLGARAARGTVLWFLHLDCEPPPQAATEILTEALRGAGWGRFDVRLSGSAFMLRIVERMMNLRSRLSGIVTGDQAMFVRRDLFHAVGGFPAIPLMEDIAISKRLKRLGRPTVLPGPILASSRRWEQKGIWRTILTMWVLRTAYSVGADPAWLARAYYPDQTA